MLGQPAAHGLSGCESESGSPALVAVPIFSQLPAGDPPSRNAPDSRRGLLGRTYNVAAKLEEEDASAWSEVGGG